MYILVYLYIIQIHIIFDIEYLYNIYLIYDIEYIHSIYSIYNTYMYNMFKIYII